MVKKLLILLVIFAVLVVTAANLAALKGPDLLRQAIGRALNKTVVIEAIDYHFPSTFELGGFQIREKGRFEGEPSFSADRIRLSVSPLSFSEKVLILDKIWVESAMIVIRQHSGKLTHSLSEAVQPPDRESTSAPKETRPTSELATTSRLPLEIHQFVVRKSQFRFVDYDVREEGFVITMNDIDAKVQNIRLPFSDEPTKYEASARIVQGREERPAKVDLAGWTVFENMDTDANIQVEGIFIPFFEPYYAQVTSARLDSGNLDARANIQSDKKDLVINVDLEIIGLLFRSYEEGDQLFGLKADEMLSFLKDRAGRLRFQIVARWNTADRSVRARDVIRKSIERSLKKTILGNLGNLIEDTIDKIEEQGFENTKNDLESKIKKIKDLFKY